MAVLISNLCLFVSYFVTIYYLNTVTVQPAEYVNNDLHSKIQNSVMVIFISQGHPIYRY